MMVELDNIEIMDILAYTTNKIAEGEVLQLINKNNFDISQEDYFKVIQAKTGVLFEACGKLASISNECSFNQKNALSTIRIKDSTGTPLGRREDGLFFPLSNTEDGFDFEAGPEAASLTPGSLEGSNVSTVHTLVKFMDHRRSFEMQTKVIREMKDNDTSGAAMMRLS